MSVATTVGYQFGRPWVLAANGSVLVNPYGPGRCAFGKCRAEDVWPNKQLLCKAHANGVRVVVGIGGSHLLPGAVEAMLLNASARARAVSELARLVSSTGADGIAVDIESLDSAALGAAHTDFVEKLSTKVPSLFVAVGCNSVFYDSKNVAYDTRALAATSDGLFMMCYDMNHLRLHQAMANSPLNEVTAGVKAALSYGVPANKLIVGAPWSGFNYTHPCNTSSRGGPCFFEAQSFQAAHVAMSWVDIQARLNDSAITRYWDSGSSSPFLERRTGQSRTQLYYDDPESLALKYALAKQHDLLGVGIWQADDAGWHSPEMWQTIVNNAPGHSFPTQSRRRLRL